MSSINGTSKYSHHNSKRSSVHSSSLASKQPKRSSNSLSSSQNSRKQSSSSIRLKDSIAPQASSPDPSYTTYISNSASDTYQSFNQESFDRLAYTQTDLLSVSAWTYPHETAHHQEPSCHSYDSTQTSSCPYHVPTTLDHHTVGAGYGMAPLERWVNENVGDGGVVTLQLGHQPRVDCTYNAIQDGSNKNAVSGTQPGFS